MMLAALFAPAAAAPLRLIAFGDSLSAGYGLPAAQAFPAQLEAALKARGHDVIVINAGVSGDTASGGLARLDWTLAAGGDAIIVELGANDALRGVEPAVTKAALDEILTRLNRRGLPVLLAGMRAPPNMGRAYADSFDAIYPALAQSRDVLFYPFFLDGVAAIPSLNQADGIHPTGRGVAVIVDGILPQVEALIARARQTD